MPLTILQAAFPFAPVGPSAVGGAEHVLAQLDGALVAAGHRSLVVACEGSSPAGQLFPVSLPSEPLGALSTTARIAAHNAYQAALDRALSSAPVDILHMHGLDFGTYRLPSHLPILVTLHMPLNGDDSFYPAGTWAHLPPNVHLVCVSEHQRRTCPSSLVPFAVIPNGVELPPEPPLTQLPSALPIGAASKILSPPDEIPDDFCLVLGRICPEKNAADALRAGTLAGLPVLIGGDVFPYPTHQAYFRNHVVPLLDAPAGPRHRFLGPLTPDRKQKLLRHARCLLHPTLAPETSSLVAMESLAAGTPVLAYPSGALPEIVDDGRTGFLVTSPETMAAALLRTGTLSRDSCQDAARTRFSLDRTLSSYFDLYHLLRDTA